MQVVKYEPKAVVKYRSPRTNKSRTPVMRRFGSIIAFIVGTLMCIPFWWHMLFGAHEPIMSLWTLCGVLLMVFGGPLAIFGLVTFFSNGNQTYNTTQSDIARIRFATETQLMRDIIKDTTKQ